MIYSNAESNTIKEIMDLILLYKGKNELNKRAYERTISIINDMLDSIRKNGTVLSSLSRLRTYDKYTFSHSINVFFISIMIGSASGLSRHQLQELGMSALLHDIGKMAVPKSILNKKARLTDPEFTIIKKHSHEGSLFAKENISISDATFLGILHHHEKYNGAGYPVGIKGEQINLYGRIISIADVYDAMTSDRPYRKALTHKEAVDFIRSNSGKCFDPEIVNTFMSDVAAGDHLSYIRP